MHDRQVYQDVLRREARRAVGLSPFGGKLRPGAVVRAGWDAEHMTLPLSTTYLNQIQDPTTGALSFMVGFSAVSISTDAVA